MNRLVGPVRDENGVSYHEEDFEEPGVFTDGLERRLWGKLAERLGIAGVLTRTLFEKLSRRDCREIVEKVPGLSPPQASAGKEKGRAYWVSLFSAPKSVSVGALIGNDERLIEAHEQAVDKGLALLEEQAEVQTAGKREGTRTGNLIVATITHDDDRPVDGVVCPQLHTHANIMNMSADGKGKIRALEMRPLYRHQRWAGLEYQYHLAVRAVELGYRIRSVEGADLWRWEILGFTDEQLEAYSLRSRQIDAVLENDTKVSRTVATIRARQGKDTADSEKTKAYVESIESKQSPGTKEIVEGASKKAAFDFPSAEVRVKGEKSVAYAISHLSERDSIMTETEISKEADFWFEAGSGSTGITEESLEADEVEAKRAVNRNSSVRVLEKISVALAIEGLRTKGVLLEVAPNEDGQRRFTTAEHVDMERRVILKMLSGKDSVSAVANQREVNSFIAAGERKAGRILNESQREAVGEVITSQDRIIGLQGYAGVGKTTVVSILKEAFEANGFKVRGLAPTARAAKLLAEVGIERETLQMFIKKKKRTAESTIFVVDESSLASVSDFNKLFETISPQDRILLLGDTRQHQSVGAGCMFETLQQAGMPTSFIDEIVRQSNIELWNVVQAAAGGDIERAMRHLQTIVYTEGVNEEVGEIIRQVRKGNQGKALVSIPNRKASKNQEDEEQIPGNFERLSELAHDYCLSPDDTLVVVPDNATRTQLNELIRERLQEINVINEDNYDSKVLVPENDTSAARSKIASTYKVGQVVRLEEDLGDLKAKTYFMVLGRDKEKNLLKVRTKTEILELKAEEIPGVSIYRVEERKFSIGEKVQFTSGDASKNIANRQQGKITEISADAFKIVSESGEQIDVSRKGPIHLDYAYGVTSYISQGQTARRVLANLESYRSGKILNERLAYVVLSRAVSELRIYTDDEEALIEALGRTSDKESAFEAYLGFEAGIRTMGEQWAGKSEGRKELANNWIDSVTGFGNGEFHELPVERTAGSRIEPEKWRAGNLFVAMERKIDIDASLQRDGEFQKFLETRKLEFQKSGEIPEEMRDPNSTKSRERRLSLEKERDGLEERITRLDRWKNEQGAFVERSVLVELERKAFERLDVEAFERIDNVRKEIAGTYGFEKLTQAEKEIQGEWRIGISIERAIRENEKKLFEVSRQHWAQEWEKGKSSSLAQIAAQVRKRGISQAEGKRRSGIVSESLAVKRREIDGRLEKLKRFEDIFERNGIEEGKMGRFAMDTLDRNALKLRNVDFVKILDETKNKGMPPEMGLLRSMTRHFLAEREYSRQVKQREDFEAAKIFRMVGYTDLSGRERTGRQYDREKNRVRTGLADLRDLGSGKNPVGNVIGGGLRFAQKQADRFGTGILGKIANGSLELLVEGPESAHRRRAVDRSVKLIEDAFRDDCKKLETFRDETRTSVERWGGTPDQLPKTLLLHHNEAEMLWKQATSGKDEGLMRMIVESYEAGTVGSIRLSDQKLGAAAPENLSWFQARTETVKSEEIWTRTPTEVHLERQRQWAVELEQNLNRENEKAKELLSNPEARSPIFAWNHETKRSEPFNFGGQEKPEQSKAGASDLRQYFAEWTKQRRDSDLDR